MRVDAAALQSILGLERCTGFTGLPAEPLLQSRLPLAAPACECLLLLSSCK